MSADGAFGGPTSVAWQQARFLARQKHAVTLIGGWDGRARIPDLDGIDVQLFRARKLVPGVGFSGMWASALGRYLMRNSRAFDVMHIHLGRDLITLSSAAIASARDLPYVVQTHGMIGPPSSLAARLLDLLITRRALLGARRSLYLTVEEKQALGEVAGPSLPLAYLRNGLVVDTAIQAQCHEDRGQTVLFCARLHPRKRVMAFADMAAVLVDRGVNATFVVAGPDQGDLPALQRRLTDSDLQGRLIYEGALSPEAVQDRLRKACVYVLPSVNEPFPMTVLEAMAAGTPVVITDSCHIAADLDRRHAALVTDGSPVGLADAVELLLTDRDAYNALQLQAHQAINNAYTIDVVGAELEDIYRTALSPGKRRR